jgi:predicted nucleic acid-binding protein
MRTAVVDAGVLYAAADSVDVAHDAVIELLEDAQTRLVVPSLALAEVDHLIGSRLGRKAEVAFVRAITEYELESPHPDDWSRMVELVERYEDLGLGLVDASIVALAERIGTPTIYTTDRRHFTVVRPAHVDSFELLPALAE